MVDRFGRRIDYIRISITDRCNLRCVYCMPEDGVASVSHGEILSYGEILRLAEIFAKLGIEKIKVTGGEPLVRKGAVELIRDLKQIPGIKKVTLTTNGICLAEHMKALAEAGVDGINLSLDTLNPDIFKEITRRDDFQKVLKGIEEALKYPTIPLKINCVPMGLRGQDELALVKFAKDHPVHVRFIEMMPIGLGKKYQPRKEAELLKELEQTYGAYKSSAEVLGNGPAHYYEFEGFKGRIGFISAVSHKFCDSCNRIRMTSQGYLKACLQYDVGVDLREALRRDATEEELKLLILECIQKKPKGHQFEENPSEREDITIDHAEQSMMSQIGG